MIHKLICFFAIALVFVPQPAASQIAAPAPQTGAAQSSAPQSAAAQPAATLHATTDLVVVDVVATDDKQSPIHHLAASDFTILEDGKPQTVKAFEEHASGPPSTMGPQPKFGPGMFSNYSPVPSSGALNILLLDKLNTPVDAQTDVRNQVLKYLKEAQPGTRMAIFSLTTELKLLQGFTTSPEVLRALVEGKKGSQQGSPLMDNQMEGDQPGADDAMMDMATDALGNDPNAAIILANLQQFEAEMQSYQLQLRQRYTLDALNQLARYMAVLPGRKNLIWFSGSFPINILPDSDLQNPFSVVASAGDEFRETVDLLSRSQVAVYPIDARGLMVPPMLNPSQSGSTMNRKPNGFASANAKWTQNTASEQGTMMQMAQATGGRAFVNTNGLKEAIEKAIDAGSNYYTIAYTPANRNWNGDFRKIQVKVDKPGMSLAYRHGYFADDPDKPAHKNGQQNALTGTGQYSPMATAMLHGAPDPTELIFVASVRPSTGESETEPAQNNQASKKLSGPYRRYTVTFLANPRQVNCPSQPDGAHHCELAFLTFVYDNDGTLLNMQTNGISANIPADKYTDAMQHNFNYRQEISVPIKGEYYLRVGMRDGSTDKVGAVEFPVAAVAKLPALTQATVQPGAAASQPK